MNLTELKCPNCNADLTVTNGTSCVCQYCGSKIILENQTPTPTNDTKFCKFCGKSIPQDAVICTSCGRQVEELKQSSPSIIINNSSNINGVPRYIETRKAKNKWIAFFLCFFLGFFGVHKFYEGKSGKGLLYLCTMGLFGLGWFVDMIVLLFKPNPYYV